MKLLLIIGSCFLFSNVIAQTPMPGGVDTATLKVWFRASSLPLGNISSWASTVPSGGNTYTLTGGNTYTLTKVDPASTSFALATNASLNRANNYNTVLSLKDNRPTNNISLGNTTNLAPLTWTGNGTSGGAGTWIIVYFISQSDTLAAPFPATGRHILHHRESQTTGDGIQFRMLQTTNRFAVGNSNSAGASRDFKETFNPTIITQRANYLTAGGGIKVNMNGTSTNLTMPSSASSGAPGLILGCRKNNTTLEGTFNGDIAELLAFSSDLTDANLVKIYSYLAIKNAITLSNDANSLGGNYVSSNDKVIWNASLGATFQNDIIGIGRDDKQGLLQKQSKTFNDSCKIYIGNLSASNIDNPASIINDTAFIILGRNTQELYNASNNMEYPSGAGITSRVSRTWKLANTNFTDSFSIDLQLDSRINIATMDTANLVLIVGAAENLTSGMVKSSANSGIRFTIVGTRLVISNITNAVFAANSTSFFTLASTNALTTLPINSLDLSATLNNNNIAKLNFETAVNGVYKNFEIQKSNDAISWTPVTKINAESLITNYTFTNTTAEVKNIFYRVMGETFDNKFFYSNIRLLQIYKNRLKFNIFPNPAKNSIDISHLNSIPKSVKIITSKGENFSHLIQQQNSSNNSIKLDISNLPKGVYYIKIEDNIGSFIKE